MGINKIDKNIIIHILIIYDKNVYNSYVLCIYKNRKDMI